MPVQCLDKIADSDLYKCISVDMERIRNFSPPVVNKLKDSYLKR
jgi:hypothetical protein